MSSSSASAFAGFRFPREVMAVAVRWYLRYGVSYRDVEELLAERGVTVDHVAAARTFFTRALATGAVPVEVNTDRAPAYPRVLDELVPTALHDTQRYANNRVEADHGPLKSRLRPMRGLRTFRSARVLATGHAFVQNLRRGHYEIATDGPVDHRLVAAFDELVLAI